ncbi:hypothetical protein ACFO3O_16415 [Dokdonia ponticola]|uniref:VWA domain-containing protein n=1 Tax=Dokdonia ponticola TaxID=2041041 RepID=A0ABV9I2M1_9FLAO
MNKLLIILGIGFLLITCKGDVNEEVAQKQESQRDHRSISSDCPDFLQKRKQDNLNISILLDLSNRIELSNQQAKDSAYISSLAKVFNTHIKNKKLGLLYDKMQVFFDPIPLDQRINKNAELLKVSYVKGVSKDILMPETLKLYDSIPSQIYDLVRKGSKKNGYPGSDIWRFFKDHVKDYVVENCRRNVLVILTDGYMYYDKTVMKDKNRTSFLTPQSLRKLQLNNSSWKEDLEKRNLGFIPATSNLEDLEVLVIGITDQNNENPYTPDIIKTYWSRWFDEMGIKKYKIKNSDIPTNIETVIADFILNKRYGI